MTALFAMLGCCVLAQENKTLTEWTSNRPDGHAPISVMGDHVHHKGEWMFSYRFMIMEMRDLHFGNEEVPNSFAFDNYMSVPQEMTMDMHMIGAMYAPIEDLTLMVMANYVSNEMGMVSKMGKNTSMSSSGLGDVSLTGLYRIFNKKRTSIHALAGLVFPTGSIDEKAMMNMMGMTHEMTLAYPMQLGSGSFSTKLGLTFLWQNQTLSGGAQANSLIRLNENDNGYRLGDQYGFTGWFAVKTTDFLSFSLRGNVHYTGEIHGQNPKLDPMMSPPSDTVNSGGLFIGYGLGANFYIPKNVLKGLRFGVELGMPLYQDLNGVQLSRDYNLILGTQYSF